MGPGDGLRLFMAVAGLAVLAMAVASLARKRMTEAFCVAWSILACMMVCGGIVLRPTVWSTFISWQGLMMVLFGIVLALAGAFFVSERVSVLARQVKELAIQVSLLNQENRGLRQEILSMTGTGKAGDADNEEDIVCHQHAGPGRSGNGSAGASAPDRPG